MKKRILALFTAIFMAAGILVLPVSAADSDNSKVTEARNGVARVLTVTVDGSVGIGSAFGVGKAGQPTDIFITNRHVVTSNNPFGGYTPGTEVYLVLDEDSLKENQYAYMDEVGDMYAIDGMGGLDADTSRMVSCKVLYYDENYDFAILKASRPVEGRVALPLASSVEKVIQPMDHVYALGYPSITDEVGNRNAVPINKVYGEQGYPVFVYTITYKSGVDNITGTTGVASVFGKMADEGDTKYIQHDAAIHGGNSGGPLVNGDGVVVGINTSGVNNTSINYALYIDYVTTKLKDEGIHFDTESSAKGGGLSATTVVVGVVVAAGLVAAALVIMKRKPASSQPAPTPQPPQPPVTGLAALRLQGIAGQFAGQRFSFAAPQLRIGRDPSRNDLVFGASTKGVSGVHCVLVYQDGTLYVQDMGSSYGTYINEGARLPASQAVALRMGDRIYLGSKEQGLQLTQKGGV